MRIKSNTRFVFVIRSTDSIDKRTKKAKLKGWSKIEHKRYGGDVVIKKEKGRCYVVINDKSDSQQLSGAWISWLKNNAIDMIFGLDIRFD